jgi:hypothetical protein
LLISSSSRFVLLFHPPFSYLGPYILLNIFLSKTRRACSSFYVTAHASAPYETTGLISVFRNRCLAITELRVFRRHWISQTVRRSDQTHYKWTCLKPETCTITVFIRTKCSSYYHGLSYRRTRGNMTSSIQWMS